MSRQETLQEAVAGAEWHKAVGRRALIECQADGLTEGLVLELSVSRRFVKIRWTGDDDLTTRWHECKDLKLVEVLPSK